MRSMVTLAARILEAVAPRLAGPVYGVPGVHNLPFWQVEGTGVPPIVVTRHEQGAGYAADGAARATGRLGVALTTTGPGAANAVTAFGEAAAARSPVLLVATEVATALAGRRVLHAMPRLDAAQAALFAPLAKAVVAPRTVAEAVEAVVGALAVATTPPCGPVYLGIPADLLDRPAHEPAPVPQPGIQAPDSADVAAAARLLDAADRVVIWVGGGAGRCTEQVGLLAARLGAPVVTTFRARGVLPAADPHVVGLPPHEPEVADLLAAADVLVVVGSDLDGMTTRNWTTPRPSALVRVDVDPAAVAEPWPADAAVVAPAADALPPLAAALARNPRQLPDLPALRRRAWDRLRAEPTGETALQILAAIDSLTAKGWSVACDMAVAGYWAGGYARVYRPGQLLYPVGWGTLGFGLPAAVGVAGTGRPTLAVCGDAGALYAVGELATAVQERSPLVLLVVDDAGYGMLRFDQERAGHPHRGVDLVGPDFVALAESFGLPAFRAATPGEPLADALAAAAATGGPALVTVEATLAPPRTTTPRWHD
jgi:acetolactate synthase-1/2/3 large subunit